MEYFNQESISLYLKIALFLVFIIPFLYVADASAYVGCSDTGICEFLDIPGICESLDIVDGSRETKHGIPTFSLSERVIYVSLTPPIKSHALIWGHNQQLAFLILRYKDLIYDDLSLSPFFIFPWFWKLILSDSKSFCLGVKRRIFFPFSQLILRTFIIIS